MASAKSRISPGRLARLHVQFASEQILTYCLQDSYFWFGKFAILTDQRWVRTPAQHARTSSISSSISATAVKLKNLDVEGRCMCSSMLHIEH